jgi:GTP-binding protein
VTAADEEVATMLLKSGKPVVLAVNKADSTGRTDPAVYEFYSLGLGDPIPCSAVHGHGTGDILDECLKYFPKEEETAEEDDRIKVAVIGKPNVGKSSLINQILGEKRVIVSDVAGTTRDAVDSEFENQYGKYLLIDTAGIRRKSKVEERVERFSVMRAQLAIERADVCLIMIDARDGVTDQDTKIAGLAHEAGKASIVIVNKWDLVEKETGTMEKMRKDIMRDLSFMSYAPILFISALTGQRTERIFELINFANDQTNMRITTGMLNDVLTDAQMRVQPPTDKGRRLKIYYMTQTGVRPPSFVVFCNRRDLFHFSYQRYLENQIRAVFGLEGTPIRMVIRQKGDTE